MALSQPSLHALASAHLAGCCAALVAEGLKPRCGGAPDAGGGACDGEMWGGRIIKHHGQESVTSCTSIFVFLPQNLSKHNLMS